MSIPFTAILTHRIKRIVIPGMRELQITLKSGKTMSFYAGKHFLAAFGYHLGQNETN